jgi:hypothetical protein
MPVAPGAHAFCVLLSVEVFPAAVFPEPPFSGTGSAGTRAVWFCAEAVAGANARVDIEAMATVGALPGLFRVMFLHHPSQFFDSSAS